jgi:hypothetical protein
VTIRSLCFVSAEAEEVCSDASLDEAPELQAVAETAMTAANKNAANFFIQFPPKVFGIKEHHKE